MVDNRPFHCAILASLGLHALVLFAFPNPTDPARRALQFPPPILARLIEPEPAAPEPAQPQAKPAIERPMPPKPKAQQAAPVLTLPTPDVQPSPNVYEPSAEPVPAPAPVSAARVAPVAAAPSAQETAQQLADQYRMQIIAAAKRIKDQKRYPPQAWENRWEGDVVLGVSIRANGRAAIVVNRSSQYEVLDKQAVQILGQALDEVPVPSALRGKDSVLKDVIVQYRQTD